ncbi:MAG: hypothetical protein J2P45_25160 [Candidatus Dormibacteraeota bacterium]|nr:hypothetical protein [Candidatus Dormibacteraeota bacterium]
MRARFIGDDPVLTAGPLLLDTHLCWVGGENFAAQLRGQAPRRLVPVVVLTTSGSRSQVEA